MRCNFKMKESKTILKNIPRACALGVHTGHLYLCGGFKIPSCGNNKYSNEIYVYDPETKFRAALTPMKLQRCYAAIIFYQEYLYVLGGCRTRVVEGGRQWVEYTNLVEKYDVKTKEWSDVAPMRERRLRFGVAVLNGKLYACGGPDSRSVEVYDPLQNNWHTVADMKRKRWDFVVVALEGKLLAIGGDNERTVEIYYPCKNEWVLDPELFSGLQLDKSTGGLIKSSCIFNEHEKELSQNKSNVK